MSESVVLRCSCKIVNQHGLHTRSAATIVAVADQYQSLITLSSVKGKSDATDMIRLMQLEASKGTEIYVTAQGVDAQQALQAISDLIEAGFNEQDD